MSGRVIVPGSVIGIIGGGQLGRMSALAAASLGFKVCVYSDKKNCPAAQVSNKIIVAPYSDKKALEKFARMVDIITFEFENIPYKTIDFLEKLTLVRPGKKALYIAQNRVREKDFINEIGLKTAPYMQVINAKSLEKAYKELELETCMLKTVELGYDGKGQMIIDKNSNFIKAWKTMGVKEAILEGFVEFEKEISVIVARCEDGGAMPYTPSENIHSDGILDTTIAPANIEPDIVDAAWEFSYKIADALELVGILAVEFFVTKDGQLLVNEIAPRPHNSGHWTMDACYTGQFEQLIRAICNWPLGSSRHHSRALMKNLIGDDVNLWEEFVDDPEAKIHIYGKSPIKEGRKMGHVTLLLSDDDELIEM